MKKISKPLENEYAVYYHQFIQQIQDENILDQLKNQAKEIQTTLLSLDEAALNTPYQPGKWTIKDILMHLIDCERVFVYRAMFFARKDKTPLPFFDENEFAKEAKATKLSIKKILQEYKAVRQASLAFFNNQTAETFKLKGIAGSTPTSVRALAWIICGHEKHHWQVIQERYLKK